MHVLICGAGRVGQGIARRLAREKHEITIIDESADLVDQVSIDLDVRGIVGHAAHPDVLKRARAADCEMIIAVTHFDEINMVICQIAHTLFSVPFKIARVRDRSYLEPAWKNIFSREGLPIDMVISPEAEVGDAILQRFRTPGTIMSANFAGGQIKLLGFELRADNPLIDVAVDQFKGLFPDLSARIIGIGRGDAVHAPRGKDVLKPGDRAYIAVFDAHASRLTSIFNTEQSRLDHVVIVGGGNVGLHVAKMLEKESHIRVRLIERDGERANKAVAAVKRSIVIQGDGLNPDILAEGGVDRADFVIAITDDDKANLLISNLAKRAGAKRALALINSPELAGLASDMRVDTVLDPRALTVSQILMRMRRGRILNLQSLEDGMAEVAEGITLETSSLIGKPLGYDDLPEGMTAAAVVRGNQIIMADEDVTVRPEDHLIVFYEAEMVRTVEKFFRVNPDYF
ncbi:potassium transporter peripheral membrane component [Hyphomonas polymorpha PS728]|uniref:Trk system potassium uptake protein TrkA n=1 Tax=Hyphomonas polymorpha PS728 TaxID=1280954 RepID=A0A062VHI7_9PROT|nr:MULTISPECIES: Trk system potassium transporter TrkA [Hyphomonas]AXE64423.1 Trk system potassium transport protein TrkA [Hyphomonas sp. CACIAM 19H1]KCZ98942.1 potassium transporter peripheral membrane component [Hyphomonas polymorpha PS728]